MEGSMKEMKFLLFSSVDGLCVRQARPHLASSGSPLGHRCSPSKSRPPPSSLSNSSTVVGS